MRVAPWAPHRGYIWSGAAGRAILVILPTAVSASSSPAVLYNLSQPERSAAQLETIYNCSDSSCDLGNDSQVANASANATSFDVFAGEELTNLILMGLLSVVLGLMILITVIGNVFVIAAILLERNLQNVANYLIVSLAVADLMVACLVMPLGAVYAISNNWIMGSELCDMWTSIDVLCCTASILHLVAIAVDRYWAVTNIDYIHTRNSHRIGVMIVVVWSIALVVSLAPQIPQFKDPGYLDRIAKKQCLVSQDVKYQIFATSSTFYVPLLVIFVLYWKIFQTARKRIRKRREMKGQVVLKVEKTNNNSRVSKNFLTKRKFLRMKKCSNKQSSAAEALMSSVVMAEGQSTTTMEILEEQDEVQSNGKQEETTAFTITKPSPIPAAVQAATAEVPPASNNVSPEKTSSATTNNGSASHQSHMSDISRVEILHKDAIPPCPASVDKLIPSRREKKESLEAKRERKAAKTLAIITGAFVMCWLPFFILALVMPLCGAACTLSDYIMSFALWLGYFNSTLNPVIYTIFNPEFRQAFKRILCGGHSRGRNFRSGKIR